jgi:hypothetical protein
MLHPHRLIVVVVIVVVVVAMMVAVVGMVMDPSPNPPMDSHPLPSDPPLLLPPVPLPNVHSVAISHNDVLPRHHPPSMTIVGRHNEDK